MRELYIFLLISFITVNQYAYAQQYAVKGIVLDRDNTPVDFVTVTLFLQNDSTLKQSAYTDSLGAFVIKAETGNYLLLLERFGKKLFQDSIWVDNELNLGKIKVNNTLLLDEVTISGNKKIIERRFDKVIFNVSSSPLKQGYNGLEVLKRSPGIRTNSNGDILLRNQSVLVMVNGRRLNFTSEELSSYLNSLNSENIESIEIQNLGFAETDASNSGGVVNIVLKKVPKGFNSTIKGSYTYRDVDHRGSYGSLNSQFGSQKWNVYNTFNYSNNGNLAKFNSTTSFLSTNNRNENDGEIDYVSRNFNTTTGIVLYPSARHEIGGEFYYSNSNVDRDGFETLMIYTPELDAVSDNTSIYDNKSNLWNAIFNYTYKLTGNGSRIKFIGDIGKHTLNNDNEVDTRYKMGPLANNRYKFVTNAASDFLNLQADWLQKLRNNWELTAGMKFATVKRNNELKALLYDGAMFIPANGSQNFNNIERVMANYVTLAKQWKEKHSIKIGLRTEYTNIAGTDFVNGSNTKKDYFDWFPNLYYGYSLEGKTISISYARRIMRPSFRDLNPFVIKQNDFLYQTGNPGLQPQYTNNLDLSYSSKNHTISAYGSFSNKIINGVYYVKDNITYYQPQNFGKSSTIGVDYSYYGKLTKWLNTNVSTGVFYYDFVIGNSKHSRFSYYNTISSQIKLLKTLFIDVYNNFSSKNQSTVTKGAAQYRLDIALQKSVFKEAGIIKFSCEDVFNTERDKNISYYNSLDFRFYQKNVTRAFSLMFIYSIKNKGKLSQKKIEQVNDNKGRL